MIDVTYRNYTGSARRPVPELLSPGHRHARVKRAANATASLQAGERVLDVACGTGVITRAAAAQTGATGAVTGVDLSPDMLEGRDGDTSGRGADRMAPGRSAASLPLPDASYHVAFCQMGLMFMAEQGRCPRQLHRVLAPGGRVILNTPGRIQPLFEVMERAIIDHINPDLGAVRLGGVLDA